MQVKIGEGKFLVTTTINGLIFKELSCPTQLGEIVDMKKYQQNVIDSFTLYFQSYEEVQDLKKLLAKSYEDKIFSFKYLDFDLTNYSRKSVDCIIDQLNWIEKFIPKCQSI